MGKFKHELSARCYCMEIRFLEGDNSFLVLWEIVLRRYMLKCLSIKCHDACNLFVNVSKKACVCVCVCMERESEYGKCSQLV